MSPVGDGHVMLQLSTYGKYALEQFDKTIRLSKLMENVHLLVKGTITLGWHSLTVSVSFAWRELILFQWFTQTIYSDHSLS